MKKIWYVSSLLTVLFASTSLSAMYSRLSSMRQPLIKGLTARAASTMPRESIPGSIYLNPRQQKALESIWESKHIANQTSTKKQFLENAYQKNKEKLQEAQKSLEDLKGAEQALRRLTDKGIFAPEPTLHKRIVGPYRELIYSAKPRMDDAYGQLMQKYQTTLGASEEALKAARKYLAVGGGSVTPQPGPSNPYTSARRMVAMQVLQDAENDRQNNYRLLQELDESYHRNSMRLRKDLDTLLAKRNNVSTSPLQRAFDDVSIQNVQHNLEKMTQEHENARETLKQVIESDNRAESAALKTYELTR